MDRFESIYQEALQFRDERDWLQFHNPKDLAISCSLEAAELLETFQWSGGDLICQERLEEQTEELADVMLYCLLLADRLGIDPLDAMEKKLEKNRLKYPVEKARGRATKYDRL